MHFFVPHFDLNFMQCLEKRIEAEKVWYIVETKKASKLHTKKLIEQDCFFPHTALTGTEEEEVKNYVIVEVACEGLVLFPVCFYTFVNYFYQ